MRQAHGIAYTMTGPEGAPVLILSNSLGTTLDMWGPQLQALTHSYRVVRYDPRGHGASSMTPGSCTLDRLGRDVLDLLDALDVERAHFCGISMGGLTGQWLGVHASERIEKLIIANTAARIGASQGWRERAALVRARGMTDVAAGAAERWFTAGFVARQPGTVQRMTDSLRALAAEGYAGCCDALSEADLRDEIGRISVPTLVIAGRYDPVTTVEDARFIVERIGHAQCVTLDASHLSNIEAPQAFNAAALAFLAS
jgi:3-oxoadipate enol-lactonase